MHNPLCHGNHLRIFQGTSLYMSEDHLEFRNKSAASPQDKKDKYAVRRLRRAWTCNVLILIRVNFCMHEESWDDCVGYTLNCVSFIKMRLLL